MTLSKSKVVDFDRVLLSKLSQTFQKQEGELRAEAGTQGKLEGGWQDLELGPGHVIGQPSA